MCEFVCVLFVEFVTSSVFSFNRDEAFRSRRLSVDGVKFVCLLFLFFGGVSIN